MILFLAVALAAAPAPDPAADHCIDEARSQPEINACSEEEWRRADAALNVAYREAMARVRANDGYMFTGDGSPAGDVLLRDAQRGWVTQRDQMCQLQVYDMRGGSAQPGAYDHCRAEATRERTAWLEQLAITE